MKGIAAPPLRSAIVTLLALLMGAWCLFGQSAQPIEYEVKAAFLFNFAKFIDWPEKSFASAGSSFTVCIIGQDPFGSALDKYFLGKTIANHTTEIDRFPSIKVAVARRCHIAFISSSEQSHFPEVIDSFRGENTLLVGDTDGFVESGGAIEFLLEDNHIRFAINPEAADRADLRVSSKLLALAQIVHDGAGKERN